MYFQNFSTVRQTLSYAMTHIDPRMKEDSLLFLDCRLHKMMKVALCGTVNYRNLPLYFVKYRKLCTGTRSIMPPFVNLDEDIISIDNCEKETSPIEIIENWCDSSTLFQLTKPLKTLFLKAAPVRYSNCINLNHTLRLIILNHLLVCLRKNCNRICIFGDIILNRNLNELYREKLFQSFVTILPSLLLKPSIDDIVIRTIS
ncbi:hypothetical protein ALC57_11674 [Trachymyrmex cornetzi]|uniref:Pre-rRNA-processing protein Ipi1 N-terminal domain-containing protein n=1 Tax=Trachymyrmex cornetzi TaxID=471704 RepID=A0A151J257_9HYME|nr:hypothetical protein ALC57_11674 [Trachymyrmex cornetzi]